MKEIKVFLLRKKSEELVDAIVIGNTTKGMLNGIIRRLSIVSKGDIDAKDLVEELERNNLRVKWLSVRERNRFDGVVYW